MFEMMDNDNKSGGGGVALASRYYPDFILSGLNDLRKRGELCDVTLVVGAAKIPAHKVVLASCSPYFAAMFTGGLAERHQAEVEFPGVEPLAMAGLVEFAYTGEPLISQANVQSLLPVANLLQLGTLKEACCRYLSAQLDHANCIGIARFSEMHACRELAGKAEAYVLQNFEEVCKGEEFLQLSEEQVAGILSSDDLNVVSEETVFSGIENWIEFDPAARRGALDRLIKCVRLALLPVRYLTRCYEANKLVRDSRACKELLNEALKYHLLPEHRLKRGAVAHRANRRGALLGTIARPRRPPKVLCALGGKNGLFAVLDSVERYDASTNTWEVVAPMLEKRINFSVATLHGFMFVVGGQNSTSHLSSCERYDAQTNQWTYVASMERPRTGLSVAVVDDQLYAVGGHSGSSYLNTVQRYDPCSDEWQDVRPMTTCRCSFTSQALVTVVDAQLCGWRTFGSSYLNTVQRYRPCSDECRTVRPMTTCRCSFSLTALCYTTDDDD
ncbi:PREDICTED: kelch-like protein 28 [Priapulus caudatus]|uniref:Kelch-like protein 28 n=1 Tax=Priapulus caudatus TaxID=37621 RepID=A0ABM1DUV0_PRICU|nr:PREDICTED: kelch-like protein 28 [Priapulus caudatus]